MDLVEAIRLGDPLLPANNTKAKGASSDPTSTADATKPKRKPVRRDPEKRRLQNIQAQKKYREKLKKRLGDLEAITARLAEGRNNNITTEEAAPPVSADRSSSSPAEVALRQPASANGDFYHDYPSQTSTCSHLAPTLNRSKYRVAAVAWAPHDDVSLLLPHTEADSVVPDLVAPWDTSTVVDPSHLIATRSSNNTIRKTEPGIFEPPPCKWFTSYIDCGCPVRHVELRRRLPYGAESLRFLEVDADASSLQVTTSSRPPDPYANHIWMAKECVVAAMWSNCLQIGITDAAFCDEDAQSPFYREAPSHDNNNTYNTLGPFLGGDGCSGSNNKKNEVHDGMVHTVQSIFKTLKPDLRPTREQITIPHHPFFDIFPFPTFRRNVLRSETLLDEDEICNDIITGLICWGGAGIGKRDRNSATGSTSSGTPWDHRSWEAKPWFLRKYWTLLGGEDGELIRQSEWWRSVRGEDEELWPVKLVTDII